MSASLVAGEKPVARQTRTPASRSVFVHVERERLGVFVSVADGEPAVRPLDEQQLGAGLLGHGGPM
jgi:hypothetical protein